MALEVESETEIASPPRRRLSRQLVLETAITMADQRGIEAVSMRRLAQELGVEAMSLYHWFGKKMDIYVGMLEAVWSEIELPPADVEWRPALRSTAMSAYRALLRHPWATGLGGSIDDVSEARLQWMDAVLGRLREAGFSPELIDLGYHVIDSHIEGVVLWLLPFQVLTRERPNFAQDFLAKHPLDNLPDMADHVAYHLRPSTGNEVSPFEFGLDLILDGLERRRQATPE
jgi:AcrR family transcriptional regulator